MRQKPSNLIALLLLVAAIATSLIWLNSCAEPSGDQAVPRHVLLISIDTLRHDHLGIYGYDRPVSPNIDALGESGVVFEQAVVQAPWTAPSHASMLTSLYPSVLNIGRYAQPGKISPAAETIAEAMQKEGFKTLAVTENGFVSPDLGFEQGFDEFHMRATSQEAVETTQKWLSSLTPDDRFFVFFHTYDVHEFEPTGKYREQFVGPYEGVLDNIEDTMAMTLQSPRNRHIVAEFTDREWDHVRDLYDGTISYVDDWMKILFDDLRQRGLFEDTLIILTSDHGEEFGEHGSSGHGYTLFDENVRVPLIFHHPSLTAGRVDPQVRVLDLGPTIFDMLSLDAPPQWQGVSLIPTMAGADTRLVAYTESAHYPLKSARTTTHKFIASTRTPYQFLYDLKSDPGEYDSIVRVRDEKLRHSMRESLLRVVRANAANMKYQGEGNADVSAETMQHLAELGYVGDSGGDPHLPSSEWIKLLEADLVPEEETEEEEEE